MDWKSMDSFYDPYDTEQNDLMYLEDDEMLLAYNNEPEWLFNLKNIFFHCMVPSIIQTLIRFSPIILSTIFIQVLSIKTYFSTKILVFTNLTISLCVLVHFFNLWITIYFTTLVIINFLLLKFKFYSNISVILTCFLHLFIGQFWLDRELWMSFRGAEMILLMKLIGFSNDFENSKDLLNFLNYNLSVSTSIIGPWISYTQYTNQLNNRSSYSKKQIKNILKYFMYTIITLICSNCLFSLLEEYLENVPFSNMYFKAFSFRQSNYFICYFAQFIVNLNQFESFNSKEKNEFIIVRQRMIELPRSMVNVVTNWNLPMHYWLKKYVFEKMKPKYGIFPSVFMTYFVSSAIHGFDPNIILVLFSLSWLAFVELNFRQKINAVGVFGKNHHSKKDSKLTLKTIDLFFYILNIYHLAYLGQIFYFDFENLNETTKFSHGIYIWSRTYFSSHIISILMFLISKFM
ncbi:unnamed protein product [Brachionus calyciflorus]|uniref:Protein-serine O-palmitoleoyltransferase porcupine n=1 Tax=Brachionus calyciflorus TaxID=104777 RepID=A0A814CBB9_9BILA|nr:unnamed protein product [Brachionus calyciflorus]